MEETSVQGFPGTWMLFAERLPRTGCSAKLLREHLEDRGYICHLLSRVTDRRARFASRSQAGHPLWILPAYAPCNGLTHTVPSLRATTAARCLCLIIVRSRISNRQQHRALPE